MRAAALVAGKDLRLEYRTRDLLSSVGLFALLVVVVASFSFPTWGQGRQGVGAGMLWMALLFAGLLGMGRSLALEKEEGCLQGLLSSPAPREAIYLGKLASLVLFVSAVEVLLVPSFLVLLQLDVGPGLPLLILAVPLGTLGIAVVGTLFATVAVQTRTREVILPLLVMPLLVPVMIAAVKATQAALEGLGVGQARTWLLLLTSYDLLFLLVGLATFPHLVEE